MIHLMDARNALKADSRPGFKWQKTQRLFLGDAGSGSSTTKLIKGLWEWDDFKNSFRNSSPKALIGPGKEKD